MLSIASFRHREPGNPVGRLLARVLLAGSVLLAQSSLGQSLADYEAAVAEAHADDRVLAHMELGLASLAENDTERAKQAFEFVLSDLESFYSNSEDAINARSVWWEEGRKSFKGEPYERAMAFYYMGVIYMMESDFENARASFVSGLLQDSFAEEDQNKSDFAAFMLLEYWSATLAGSEALAASALKDLRELRPEFQVPDPHSHVLVILETGLAPRKLNDGVSGERLVFRRGKGFDDRYAYVSIPDTGHHVNMVPMEDIYYQASTRGARAIDGINGGKASYKQSWTDRASSVANLANQFTLYSNLSRDYSHYYAMQDYGVSADQVNLNIEIYSQEISAAASLVSLIGSRFRAEADTRYWSNLPDTLHFAFVPRDVLQGGEELKLTYQDQRRSDIGEITLPINEQQALQPVFWSKVH